MERRDTFFTRLWRGSGHAQRGILIALSIMIILDVFIEVVLRYVFQHPILGTDEIAILLGIWIYFFGAAEATRTKTNIEGGLVGSVITRRSYIKWINRVVPLVTVAVCLLFCYFAAVYSIWLIENNVTYTAIVFPKIYGEVSMLLGAVLITVYFLVDIASRIKDRNF